MSPLDSLPHLEPEALDAFLAGPGTRALLVAGDAPRRPEAVDVAVVLRELAKQRPSLAVAVTADSPAVRGRLDVPIDPSLVLIRDGAVREVIPGIKDWHVYTKKLETIMGGND